MPERVSRKDLAINTIIGPNTNVWGDVSSDGFTRVDGNVRGDMDAKGRVVVGEHARMLSNIIGTTVTIGGVVRGNVLASERLVILSTGLVLGDVITRRIQTDAGCIVHGRITVCRDEAAWQTAIAEYQDARGVHDVLSGGEAKSA